MLGFEKSSVLRVVALVPGGSADGRGWLRVERDTARPLGALPCYGDLSQIQTGRESTPAHNNPPAVCLPSPDEAPGLTGPRGPASGPRRALPALRPPGGHEAVLPSRTAPWSRKTSSDLGGKSAANPKPNRQPLHDVSC
jgi:hypothetical protein